MGGSCGCHHDVNKKGQSLAHGRVFLNFCCHLWKVAPPLESGWVPVGQAYPKLQWQGLRPLIFGQVWPGMQWPTRGTAFWGRLQTFGRTFGTTTLLASFSWVVISLRQNIWHTFRCFFHLWPCLIFCLGGTDTRV